MEIKKGISQMTEYPNREINYVVSSDGKMYYVLQDGELKNGAVIATLDPKRAIDSSVSCDNIGVFKEDGSVLIDFDKKDIKKVTDDLLLVVNSKPISNEVIDALSKENDEANKVLLQDSTTAIIDKLIEEMGITGEILFSDAYSEANIYNIDSYNNKIGIESSFIGKNNENLYFHTNLVNTDTKVVKYVEEQSNNSFDITNNIPKIEDDIENIEPQELKLDISKDILEGFKPLEENVTSKEIVNEENNYDTSTVNDEADNSNNDEDVSGDEVLDNAIETIKKMIEETNKLNEKISSLEKELEEKNKIIEEQESKKNTLNSLLNEANEVLENID